MPTLADAIRGLVRKSLPKERFIKRVEVIGVAEDGSGIHLLADGQAATVSGHGEFRPGEIVDVIGQDTPLILGHKWQKGDVPGITVRATEEVEEIVMTTSTNPDGGLDHFLRSWRGVFYLDLRAAVAEAVTDPTKYADIDNSSGSRFPGSVFFFQGAGNWVRFGQTDNTIGVLVTGGDANFELFEVLYLFKIARPVGRDAVPTTGAVRRFGIIDYPVADLRLIGLYDFQQLDVPTGVSASISSATTFRQLLCANEIEADADYDYSFEGFLIRPAPAISMTTQTFSTPLTGSTEYQLVLDAAHNAFLNGSAVPYMWKLEGYWIDAEDRPMLVISVSNTFQASMGADLMVHAAFPWGLHRSQISLIRSTPLQGQVITATALNAYYDLTSFPGGGLVFGFVGGPDDFSEDPIFVVSLIGNELHGPTVGLILGKTCPDHLIVNASRDTWYDRQSTFNNTLQIGAVKWTIHLHGGQDVIPPEYADIISPLVFWTPLWFNLANRDNFDATFPGGEEPANHYPVQEVGHVAMRDSMVSYSSTGPKPPLIPLFRNAASLGSVFEWTRYLFGAAALYMTVDRGNNAFSTGGAPSSFPTVLDGRAGRSGGFDLLFANRHILSTPVSQQGQPSPPRQEEVVLGVWRNSANEDTAVIFREAQDGSIEPTAPNPMMNRDFVLLEQPREAARQIASLDGAILATVASDLAEINGRDRLCLLAPDRLFDKAEDTNKFRQPGSPGSVLAKPRTLASIDALRTLGLYSDPTDVIHTVGTRR